jgi:hypothetical protein
LGKPKAEPPKPGHEVPGYAEHFTGFFQKSETVPA